MNDIIPRYKIRIIRKNHLDKTLKNYTLAKQLGITPPTVYSHIRKFIEMGRLYPKHGTDINFFVPKVKRLFPRTKKYAEFSAILPELFEQATGKRIEIKQLWEAYHTVYPNGYTWYAFKTNYLRWHGKNPLCIHTPGRVKYISDEDADILKQWCDGFDLDKWRRATVIKASYARTPLSDISAQSKLTVRTLQKYIAAYNENGLEGLKKKKGITYARFIKPKAERTIKIMRLIHETPKLHGINRTSWRLIDLSLAYNTLHGATISCSAIRNILKLNGYLFKKAKVVLTSPDPKFREKLENIKSILSNLKENEKFFSVDEFGPCAIKMKPGWSFVKADELKSVARLQKSRGWFICTAALELSKNQVTHFYSRSKDTEEMITLISMLQLQYAAQKMLYISWDAAPWHNSKKLKAFVTKTNEAAASDDYTTPCVELVPLPSSAQFLNVIESVFSGLAKSIIHNSDYGSVDECKGAIDQYFQERNEHFVAHHKKAGNMIWKKELVKSEFDETQNCKDPRFS